MYLLRTSVCGDHTKVYFNNDPDETFLNSKMQLNINLGNCRHKFWTLLTNFGIILSVII
jgi:hypothetical protein